MFIRNRQACVINWAAAEMKASAEVYVRLRQQENTTCVYVLMLFHHSASLYLSVCSQRLKDEIAEVTSEIENLGQTEER